MTNCANLSDIFCTVARCEALEAEIELLKELLNQKCDKTTCDELENRIITLQDIVDEHLGQTIPTAHALETQYCTQDECEQIRKDLQNHIFTSIPGAHPLECELDINASINGNVLTFNVNSCIGNDSASVEIPSDDFDLDDLLNTIANLLDLINLLKDQQNDFCTKEECNNITTEITNNITNIVTNIVNNTITNIGGGGGSNGGDEMPCDLTPVLNRLDDLEVLVRVIRDALEVASSSQVVIGECKQPDDDEGARFEWQPNDETTVLIDGQGLVAIYQYCQAILQKMQAIHESSCMGVQLTSKISPINEIPIVVCREQDDVDAENQQILQQIAEGSLPPDTPLAERIETITFRPDGTETSMQRLQLIAPIPLLTRLLPVITSVAARLWSRIDPNTRQFLVETVLSWAISTALDALFNVLTSNQNEQTRVLCELEDKETDVDINLIIPQNTDFTTQVKETLLISFVRPSNIQPGTRFKPLDRSRWTRQVPLPTNRAKGLDDEGLPIKGFDIYSEFYNELVLHIGDIFATIILSRVVITPDDEELINTAKITGRYPNEASVVNYAQFMLGNNAPAEIIVNGKSFTGNPFNNREAITKFNKLQEIRMVNCGNEEGESTILRPYIIKVKDREQVLTRIQAP